MLIRSLFEKLIQVDNDPDISRCGFRVEDLLEGGRTARKLPVLLTSIAAVLMLFLPAAADAAAADPVYVAGASDPKRFAWIEPEGRVPIRGAVIFIHGGGWFGDKGVIQHQAIRKHHADKGLNQGFAVLSVTYRSGFEDSLSDIKEAYSIARRRVGAYSPVCALGRSAGGHLALMLSAARERLDCAISEGGPVNLSNPTEDTLFLINFWLGETPDVDLLNDLSPQVIFETKALSRRVLMAAVSDDSHAIHSQMDSLAASVNANRGWAKSFNLASLPLEAGGVNFIHGSVSPQSYTLYKRKLGRLLTMVVKSRKNLRVNRRLTGKQRRLKKRLKRVRKLRRQRFVQRKLRKTTDRKRGLILPLYLSK